MTDAWIHEELSGWSPGFGRPRVDVAAPAPQPVRYVEAYTPDNPPPEGPPVSLRAVNALGIDVSNYQGTPNWAQVAGSGRQFAYVKATEGVSYLSPALDAQYNGAASAGLSVGLYHFADSTTSPEANADAFSAQVNRLGAVQGHLPPCLDLETGTGDLSGWAQRFITRLRSNTGCVRVVVYSSASFFKTQIGESWMDSNIALWIASWGTVPGQPSYLTPRVAIHQYANNGQVSGITGNVDLDFAVWPLSTLVPAAPTAISVAATSVLTDAEESMLTGISQQMSGSATPGQWPGWPSWTGGSGRTLTLLDYLRQADTQLVALKAQISALQAQGVQAAPLSATDIANIASAVANMLAARLQS